MNERPPHTSVVIPAYNAATTIVRALESVGRQSLPPSEVIIVDDGSSDHTADLAEQFAHRRSGWTVVRLTSNSGRPATPRNAALKVARGRYVAFLDADDFWLTDKLRKQLTLMISTRAHISATGVCFLGPRGKRRGIYTPPQTTTMGGLLRLNSLLLSSVIVDREALAHDLDLPRLSFPEQGHEDYALWLSLLNAGAKAENVISPEVVIEKRPGSVSSSPIRNLNYLYGAYRFGTGQDRASAIRFALRYAYAAHRRPLSREPWPLGADSMATL